LVLAREKVNWQQVLEEPRTQQEPPRSKRTAKPRQRPNTKPVKQFFGLFVALFITAVIGAQTVNLTVVKGAHIRELREEVEALKQQNEQLSLEVEKLRSITRIEKEALAMGMVKPEGTVYVAGALPEIRSQAGTSAPRVASSQPAEPQTESFLKKISQKFTSFFASTQR